MVIKISTACLWNRCCSYANSRLKKNTAGCCYSDCAPSANGCRSQLQWHSCRRDHLFVQRAPGNDWPPSDHSETGTTYSPFEAAPTTVYFLPDALSGITCAFQHRRRGSHDCGTERQNGAYRIVENGVNWYVVLKPAASTLCSKKQRQRLF